ncbi:MAG: TIGR03557 family F420-dependent LLM class oxidoreductase [Chloroflexi bacterium]|nr:TIGR03557 family F420-dependent LLM class oxidoreductase [Chloroflexota bacterium]
MTTPHFGYTLSSEEHSPRTLVANALAAEAAGFDYVSISDHFHPWIDRQGHSPFVWSVIGGVAATTKRVALGTGVTCPTTRIHPVIIAQAAATSACMMPGRFVLGVGTGESLNEHITGERWPEYEVRAERLEESIEVIRALWTGENTSHHGRHYTVENARIYDLPAELPAIIVAAGGPRSAELAAHVGDGLWLSSIDADTIDAYRQAGGAGPIYAQVQVCWGPSKEEALRQAHEAWPNAGIKGQASQELPSPAHFGELAAMVKPEDIANELPHGPDVAEIGAALTSAVGAGVTHVHVHQIGPDQTAFLDMARTELLPRLRRG